MTDESPSQDPGEAGPERPKLSRRPLLGGYRVKDVDAAIDALLEAAGKRRSALEERIASLERERDMMRHERDSARRQRESTAREREELAAQLAEQRRELDDVRRRQSELEAAAQDAERLRGRERELDEALRAVHFRAIEIERSARERATQVEADAARAAEAKRSEADEAARRIVADARREAQRVHDEAEAQAAAARLEAAEAAAVKRTLVATLNDALGRVGELTRRIEQGEPVREELGDLERLTRRSEPPPPQQPPAPAAPAGEREASAPARPPDPAGQRPAPPARVLLDAGPFRDADAADAFERELRALPLVGQVERRRFDGERVVLEVADAESGPLTFAIRDLLRHGIVSAETEADRLTLNLASGPDRAGAR